MNTSNLTPALADKYGTREKNVTVFNDVELNLFRQAVIADYLSKQWISVDVALPEVSKSAKDFKLASGESDHVLVLLNGQPMIATYHVNIEQWSLPWHHGEVPTHWMPLPEFKDTK